jgi:hypothetical protein
MERSNNKPHKLHPICPSKIKHLGRKGNLKLTMWDILQVIKIA